MGGCYRDDSRLTVANETEMLNLHVHSEVDGVK